MEKERKYIKIFALTLFFMICLSVNANVNAETNYFDDNGVMYRLVFDDTPLKNFVKRDFALYYNQKDLQNEDIAKLTATSKSGTYTYSNGFAKSKDLKIIIFETSESWQQNNNQKYIVYVLPDYVSGNYNSVETRINDNVIVKRGDTYKYYWFSGDRYYKEREFGIDNLNFNKNDSNVKLQSGIGLNNIYGDTELLIIVNKDGEIRRWNDLSEYDNNLYVQIRDSARYNLIYSNLDVYNEQGTEIIKPKEDFEQRKDIIVKREIKVNQDESNEINFKIFNLKKDDKIKVIKKDKNGNYTESDIIERTITIDLNENQSYLVKDENVKENKIYDIKVYDSKNKIIYSEEYVHSLKNYILEDTTQEKNKLINLENYKINSKVANLIKNVFIISNNSYLGKIIFLVFTITIIAIIRKKV